MTRLLLPLVLFLAFAPGCVTLSTWERATLVSAAMEDPASPMEATLEEHVHAVREAAQGATSTVGSSCGCN
ncbi:MAG: DUF4266 domain-containing protein [Proteobacteria bacterium]|nr:DUF4266 domain-containing protein [Pseudomonadota bacterium]